MVKLELLDSDFDLETTFQEKEKKSTSGKIVVNYTTTMWHIFAIIITGHLQINQMKPTKLRKKSRK